MTLFFQICGGVLVSVVLILVLKSYCKEISTILAIVVCCFAAVTALRFLQPILDFVQQLEKLGGLDNSMVAALLKATGIGIITEIVNLICKDAGNESMGKSMQLLGTAAILYLSMPLFYALIDLLQKILGDL